jgi:flagellar biosynthetic protein FliP
MTPTSPNRLPATRAPATKILRAALLALAVVLGVATTLGASAVAAAPAAAQAVDPSTTTPEQVITPPQAPAVPDAGAQTPGTNPNTGINDGVNDSSTLDINLNAGEKPSKSIVIIILLTVLALAPSLLIMVTPFTRIVVVFSLARNALGVPSVPPNQVMVGLSLFLSLFIMAPTLKQMNEVGLQPLLNDQVTEQQAYEAAIVPLKEFMLDNTRKEELALFVNLSGDEKPANPQDVEITSLIPAYILSELQSAMIIGFVIFVPFLVIDLVVSAVLMSLGMMMLPPVVVSLPFKILLFVMVGGWTLIVETLVRSFH